MNDSAIVAAAYLAAAMPTIYSATYGREMDGLRVRPRRLRSRLGLPAIAALWLLAVSVPAYADAAAGRRAYEEGNYGRAMAEWQAAADKNDPEAEFGLGNLYEFGAGDLTQDYRRAAYWYRKAAEQGNVEAEYRLSLIDAAGADNFPSDLAAAYKWAVLAAGSPGVWGSLATDFKKLLDQVTTPDLRAEAEKRAAAWTAAPAITAAGPAAAIPAPPPPPAGKSGGCPGWPFPTLPCTEQFPALTGMPAPAQAPAPSPPVQQVAARPPPPAAAKTPPAAKPSPLVGLNEALARIDCASLQGRTAADGAAVITGTVPDAEQKAQLLRLAAEYFPAGRNEIAVDVVPPPICRSLVALNLLNPAGESAKDGLGLRLDNGSNRLREGDPIDLEVHAPDYPVDLRIDYFSLDGRVLHLKPGGGELAPELAAGKTHLFGDPANGEDWRAGGAPFGTELIAVVATPTPLALGVRPRVEEAVPYLRDLKRAFDRIDAGSGAPGLVATLLVETSGRQ
jgi:Sel1 repeat-containing protein